ncbi:hypothetical protein [Rhizomicrobium electricum]|uniref:Uncharacterized protein n=1 Tax=Rhizomicrobium electricum TaxID=480070 RepID=A0ABP3PF75_9PROT|nr:hypothetical protein [Rhizomicrobium electricum]NIJ48672.1 hypothetical protein [Rhizomicrobium electricum]
MDIELGRMVAGAANRAGAELGDLALLIKDHVTPEEREVLRLAIGSAVFETGELMERVFALCPGLREEFEGRLEKYLRCY